MSSDLDKYLWRVPKNVTPEWLQEQYEKKTFIPMEELEDRAVYRGKCRNATKAVWNAEKQVFTYMRTKFHDTFPEDINPIERDDGYDLFIPWFKIEVEE